MSEIINLSVICATHNGKNKIQNLIQSIKNNSVLPSEIIVCGTSKFDLENVKKDLIETLNIKFLLSDKKSQIYQRSLAFKKSNSDYILQIDDDVVIENNFFENLQKYTKDKNGENKIIISALILQSNGKMQAGQWNSVYNKYFLFRFIIRLLNGFDQIKEYSILKSGRCIPYIIKRKNTENKTVGDVEWLCSTVIYHRSCVKDVKFIPQISNKAYYEDVFFSHQLFLKGYKLIIDNEIIGIHDNQPYTSTKVYFKTLKTQYNLVKIFNKSRVLFFLDVIIFTIIHSVRDIYLKIFKKENI